MDNEKKNKKHDPFKEYHRASDPSKKEKAYYWRTAIGLQEVDGLTPSPYLLETAKKNIEGEISAEEVYRLLDSYYQEKREQEQERTQEADVVSARIAHILGEQGFTFSVAQILSIHRRLFEGIFPHAGELRPFNITKKEWVLDGDSVTYGTAPELVATLEYDLEKERTFRYDGLSDRQVVARLAAFLAGLWQIHPFAEGNTRAVAVFFIKYLRTLGFSGVTNDAFAKNSLYFRNALVRANYTNLRLSVRATTTYLEGFLRAVLYGEEVVLKNRTLHILYEKQPFGAKEKTTDGASQKSILHFDALVAALGKDAVFGRKEVVSILKLSPAAASSLLKKLLFLSWIQAVKGQGKGKYRFTQDN